MSEKRKTPYPRIRGAQVTLVGWEVQDIGAEGTSLLLGHSMTLRERMDPGYD